MYDSVVDESVPDEFLSFLHQADKAEKREADADAKEGESRPNGGSGAKEAGS
jgi:hypothetical protein